MNLKTKFIWLLFLLCIASAQLARAFQNDDNLALPKVEDVQKIETTNNEFRFQTPESLWRMLPNMTAKTSGNLKIPGYQYGTILLKNGTLLKWRSSHYGKVFLYDDKHEQLYTEDASFWSYFLGEFVYTVASLVLFSFFLGYFIWRKKQPENDPGFFSRESLKSVGIRLLAFIIFVGLGYLLLQTPLQQINEGVLEVTGKGISKPYLEFADTEPGNFWFSIFLNSIFGLVSIFFGILFLSLNPRSKFWKRKPQPVKI